MPRHRCAIPADDRVEHRRHWVRHREVEDPRGPMGRVLWGSCGRFTWQANTGGVNPPRLSSALRVDRVGTCRAPWCARARTSRMVRSFPAREPSQDGVGNSQTYSMEVGPGDERAGLPCAAVDPVHGIDVGEQAGPARAVSRQLQRHAGSGFPLRRRGCIARRGHTVRESPVSRGSTGCRARDLPHGHGRYRHHRTHGPGAHAGHVRPCARSLGRSR